MQKKIKFKMAIITVECFILNLNVTKKFVGLVTKVAKKVLSLKPPNVGVHCLTRLSV